MHPGVGCISAPSAPTGQILIRNGEMPNYTAHKGAPAASMNISSSYLESSLVVFATLFGDSSLNPSHP